MKVSQIDKDFIEIIDFLNDNGFRPWSSCDGVLEHHEQNNKPTNAYISFLKSKKIIELMAAFLRDKSNFRISLSNNTHTMPYEYYGNIIEGNTYGVYFDNLNGERTDYFYKIIRGIVNDEISISDDEKEILIKLSDCLDNTEDSELIFTVNLNQNYKPFMEKDGKTNSLTISTKDGIKYNRNMQECAELISEEYRISLKRDDFNENFGDTQEFIVTQFDKGSLEYYFQGYDLSKVLGIINYAKSKEKNLTTFVAVEPDYYDDYLVQ